ncbi:PQ-loop repeat-containing protein 1-like protein [Euroglyphus maynei]|uniref:PQ-loop repeat-containing protein 1-like protein n=1 Tax=Euroglyphus maynei TaxID=6958 RepID=A0A1Y3B671_EURMA|nr:PQ-loop repeat-containing protein 1-like protein [Euroglyphus maynei]
MSYLECMAVFTLITGLIFYFFIDVPLIVEGYGLVALVTESLLASPQFFRNLKFKSVEGMSKLMVLTWFLGDLYKTVYFFVRQAPFQFLLCGCTQITFDSLIFLQILCYKKASYRKIPKSYSI